MDIFLSHYAVLLYSFRGMSTAHSTASKLRWAHIPLAERTKKMRAIAKKKWEKVSPRKRREYAITKLVNGRKKKANKKKS